MDLEHELKRLRLAAAPTVLRARVLRDARASARRAPLVPPWFGAIEGHWLYPGRTAVAGLVVAWLVIASFHFTTPASLVPVSGPLSRISADDLARIEMERAQLLAELRADEFESRNPAPTELPPRS